MSKLLQDLFDSRTIQAFDTLAREVVDLVDAGRVDYAFTKINAMESYVRSMNFTEPMLKALPGLTQQSLAAMFGCGSISAIGTPVLAYSGTGRPFLDVLCEVIWDFCKFALKAGAAIAGIALVVWGSGVWVAVGYALFVIFVLWVVWEGQQPPRVALQSNPTFMARLQREIDVVGQQAKRSLIT